MPDQAVQASAETIPRDILEAVKQRQCIVFLGAAANAASPDGSEFTYTTAPPSGSKMSEMLAKRIGYEHSDVSNLQRVSLYAEFQSKGQWTASRDNLIDFIRAEVAGPKIMPSPILRMLAEMPFPIYMTTNYDSLLEASVFRAKTLDGIPKVPIIRIYDPKRNKPPEQVPLDPEERKPVVFKLHGDIDKGESLVVTEEDYLEFILKMTDNHAHPIPNQIRARLNEWLTLFIGYSLKDYNLRLLLRTLRWNIDQVFKPFFSVDRFPDEVIVSVFQNREKIKVNFIRTDVWNFVPTLYQVIHGRPYRED